MIRSIWITHGRIGAILLALVIGLGSILMIPAPAVAESTVSGDITTDTTWNSSGNPYTVTGNIVVYGTDTNDGVVTLTINPGVVVKFRPNMCLRIGSGSTTGKLVAEGTANAKITFTGTDTQFGSWMGILFDPGSSDRSVIDYAVVQYGGGLNTTGANIYLNNASPTVSNSDILNSDDYGIMCSGTDSTPTIVCNRISDNKYGIYAQNNSNPVVKYNTITRNSEYAVYNASSGLLNAENNWWGSASGPNISGAGLNKVSTNVDFNPWLSAQPSCPIPEWATATLVLAGLSGIAGFLWFRKRQRAESSGG